MEETKIELQLIKLSEIQSQEVSWLWFPFILWQADNYSRRPGRRKDNICIEHSGEAVKGRGIRQ